MLREGFVKLTKERKVYMAIFGLGLAALAVDRMFFSPAPAGAAPEPPTGAPGATPPAQKPPATADLPAGPSFGERLAARASWGRYAVTPRGPGFLFPTVHDAFVAPEAWVGKRTAVEPAEGPVPEAEFVQKHKLSTVAKGPMQCMAIVDTKTYWSRSKTSRAEGKTPLLDGYELVDVKDGDDAQSATFERDGVRVMLVAPPKSAQKRTDKPKPR